MSEQIRSVLDAAAADVQPRIADPVTPAVRRGRVMRRRRAAWAAVAGVVSAFLALTGAIVAVRAWSGRPPLSVPAESAATPSGATCRSTRSAARSGSAD